MHWDFMLFAISMLIEEKFMLVNLNNDDGCFRNSTNDSEAPFVFVRTTETINQTLKLQLFV